MVNLTKLAGMHRLNPMLPDFPDIEEIEQGRREQKAKSLLNYARIAVQRGQGVNQKVFDQLMELLPQEAEVYYLLGRQYQLLDIFDEAWHAYEHAANLRSDVEEYALCAADCAAYAMCVDEAMGLINWALVNFPNSAQAYYQRGTYQFFRKDFRRALDDFIRAHKLKPNEPDYLVKLGNTYLELKQYEGAEEIFKRLKRIDPENTWADTGLQKIPSMYKALRWLPRKEDEKTRVPAAQTITGDIF